jgi:hypothetical protein
MVMNAWYRLNQKHFVAIDRVMVGFSKVNLLIDFK